MDFYQRKLADIDERRAAAEKTLKGALGVGVFFVGGGGSVACLLLTLLSLISLLDLRAQRERVNKSLQAISSGATEQVTITLFNC